MSTSNKRQSADSFLADINPFIVLIIFLAMIVSLMLWLNTKPENLMTEMVWEQQIDKLGVGSPRLADVNRDGTMDIFIGSGFEWSEDGESAMLLINGKTGDVIWRTETPRSSYGTPLLIDINDDKIVDVTASGRFSDFYMLSGKNGDILWKLSEQNVDNKFLPCNFNTPIFVKDQDNDGIKDVLVIQSGLADNADYIKIIDQKTGEILIDKYAKKSIEKKMKEFLSSTTDQELLLKLCQGDQCEIKTVHRTMFERYTFDVFMSKLFLNQEGPGGIVYVISSKTGKILRQFAVPKQRESWSTPIYFIHQNKEYLIYGSGGERKDGFLQAQDFLTGETIWSIHSENKGIISSPILYIEENKPYIISNSMGGDLWKVNALTGDIIWHKSVGKEYESYSSPAVIKKSDGFDIVSVYARGIWPKYESSSLFIFDGKTGEIKRQKKVGQCNSAASPLIADLNNDNLEDILLVTCVDRQARLLILNHDYIEILEYQLTSGGYATPVITDMDNDTHLDMIIPRFHFMNRFRLSDQFTSGVPLNWNQYRGINWSGKRLNR